MKKHIFKGILILLVFLFLLSSCATATPVPPNATPEQLALIDSQNLNAIATNTSTLTGIQLASLAAGFFVGLMGGMVMY